MKRLFMILSAAFGPVVLAFGQEDSTRLRLMPNLLPKLACDTVPVLVDNGEKLFGERNKRFSTYPMPNGYRGDNCVPIPNAYRGDNSVSIPNVYRDPIVRRHPIDTADSIQQSGKKDEQEKGEESRAEQPSPR